MSVPLLITSQLPVVSTVGVNEMSFLYYIFGGALSLFFQASGVESSTWSRTRFYGLFTNLISLTKYHIAWAAEGCCYCHDCMFCFQPNELKWYHLLRDSRINEETQKRPPFDVKIMMSLSMQLNELRTHRHSGGHFQPINSESAQNRMENNLLHPETNAAPSQTGRDNPAHYLPLC